MRPPRNDKFGRFCGKTEQFPERNDRKRNNFRNETFEKRCEATPRKNERIKRKTSVFKQKRPDSVSLRGRSAAVAILKFEARYSVTKHGSTKQKGSPITKNMDSLPHSASSLFIYGSVSFRPTIVRFGMANRFVKDCRVGRTRPPRNDKKLAGFCEKPISFLK